MLAWRPPFPVPSRAPSCGAHDGKLGAQASQIFARRSNPIRTGGLEEKDNIGERSPSEKEKKPNRVGWSFRLGEEYGRAVYTRASTLGGRAPREQLRMRN